MVFAVWFVTLCKKMVMAEDLRDLVLRLKGERSRAKRAARGHRIVVLD